jgi:hypothetical protein
VPNTTDLLQIALNFWSTAMNEIYLLLGLAPDEFKSGVVWELITLLHGAMQSIGYALLVIFFLVGVIKTTASFAEMKRPEMIFKLFLRFAIAKALIQYSLEILVMLYRVAQVMIRAVARVSGGTDIDIVSYPALTVPPEIVTALADVSTIQKLLLWMLGLIGVLIIVGCSFVIILTVYGRFFRLFLYTAIAPIPLAGVAGSPTQSMGISFIRNYAGVCLEGVIIIMSCAIYGVLTKGGAILPSFVADANAFAILLAYIVETIFNLIILLITIKTASQIVKEMMGL